MEERQNHEHEKVACGVSFFAGLLSRFRHNNLLRPRQASPRRPLAGGDYAVYPDQGARAGKAELLPSIRTTMLMGKTTSISTAARRATSLPILLRAGSVYHGNVKKNGAVLTDTDVAFSLHDVQDLVVMPAEQDMKRSYAAAGHPTWEPRFDPPMFLVVERRAGNQANGFYFADEEMANRVAKALVHAVELCGGGSKDPF